MKHEEAKQAGERKEARDEKSDQADLLSISAEFSADLSLGGNPDFDKWLAKVAPDRQQSLLKRLESVANAFSLVQSESSGNHQTLDAIPALSASASPETVDANPETDASATQTFNRSPPIQQLGGYDLIGELGRGGMGIVYHARHRERGDVVALKILPRSDGESLHRFKREFRSLSDISHPNLVGLRELEQVDQQWFLTMDLVNDAQNFRDFVRHNKHLNFGRLRSAMLQLAEGLRQLHDRDILHRDLKPSNVMVDANGRVVILDFGLVSELKRSDQTLEVQSVSGTPAYMSPEGAASEQESFASDYYAVGVMLYEALSDELPFQGDPVQIMLQKQSRDAPDLTAEGVSHPLKELCMQLLSRDPAKRPGYAAIREVFHENPQAADSHNPSLNRPDALIGRDWQLSILQASFATVEQEREPTVAFVRGKSGEGKSALVAEFLRMLKDKKEITLLAGRCYDRESVPFKALDSLIDSLASHLRTLDPIRTAALLPDDTGLLARVFPVLTRVEIIAQRPMPEIASLDEKQIRKRAFAALKELLRRLAEQTSLVLFCDDLQWGDSDSAQVFGDVFSGEGVPKLLMVGSYRVDECEGSPFLQTWEKLNQSLGGVSATTHVDVGPLSETECLELVRMRFSQLPVERARQLATEAFAETGGNAFLIGEVLDCLVITGDRFQRIPMSQVLSQKLGSLPANASDVLNMIAISGQALATSELLQAVGQDASAYSLLNAMRNQRLVRFVDEQQLSRIDTYHDKIRETVLDALGTQAEQGLHEQLAEVIEGNAPELDLGLVSAIMEGSDAIHPDVDRIYDLSFHFQAAGNSRKAAAYSLLAGEQAERQFSPEVAAERFRMARENLGKANPAVRFRCSKSLAKALMLCGHYAETEEALDGILELVDDSIKLASAELVFAEVRFKQGRLEESQSYCVSGLARLGEKVPESKLGYCYALLREVSIQIGHTLFPNRLGKNPPTPESQLIASLLSRLTYVNCFNSTPMMFWSPIRAMNLGERYHPDTPLAMAYGLHAAILTFVLSWKSRGDKFAQKAMQINEQNGNQWGIAASNCWQGISCFATADYRNGIRFLENAGTQFEQVGDAWEANFARFHLGMCHLALGDFSNAKRVQESTCRASIAIGDSRALCSSYGWARASEGTLPLEELREEIPKVPEDYLSTINYLKAEGYWHLANGQSQDAIQYFDDALRILLRTWQVQAHTIALLPLLARALRGRAQEVAEHDVGESKRLIKRAKRIGNRGAWLAIIMRTERSAALRELGLVYEALQKKKQAVRYLEKSCEVAIKQDERYELAQSRFELSRLRLSLGDESQHAFETVRNELHKFHELAKQ